MLRLMNEYEDEIIIVSLMINKLKKMIFVLI